MAIVSLDGYLAAFKQHRQISKLVSVVTVAGAFSHLFDRTGFPGAGATNPGNVASGVVPTDLTAGAVLLDAFQGANRGYLSRVEAQWNATGQLALFDLLFWVGPTTIPTVGSTVVTLGGQPSYASRVPFKADGTTRDFEGETELWAWPSVAWSNHAHSLSVNYDAQVNPGQSTGAVSTQNIIVNRMIRLPWATGAGNQGVSRINSYTVVGATSASGAVVVAVLRRLWQGRISNTNALQTFGPDLTGMPEVYADSCLLLACQPDGASSGLPNLVLEIADG